MGPLPIMFSVKHSWHLWQGIKLTVHQTKFSMVESTQKVRSSLRNLWRLWWEQCHTQNSLSEGVLGCEVQQRRGTVGEWTCEAVGRAQVGDGSVYWLWRSCELTDEMREGEGDGDGVGPMAWGKWAQLEVSKAISPEGKLGQRGKC